MSLNLVLNSNHLLQNYYSQEKKLTSKHSEVRALQDTIFAMFCTRFIQTAATLFSVAQVTALKIGSLQMESQFWKFKTDFTLHTGRKTNVIKKRNTCNYSI
jgi:hypothetical protein